MAEPNINRKDQSPQYRIVVEGIVDGSWADWFQGLKISHTSQSNGVYLTCLQGGLVDQPALRAVINRLWNLNLILVQVERLQSAGDGQ